MWVHPVEVKVEFSHAGGSATDNMGGIGVIRPVSRDYGLP